MKKFALKWKQKKGEASRGGGGDSNSAQTLIDAFVTGYDEMKEEFDDMDNDNKKEFLELLG